MRSMRHCVCGLLALVAVACSTRQARPPLRGAPDARSYPGRLRPSAELPDGLFYRQRIEARFGERELSFSAVLQVGDGALTLLALTPYGSRAFLIEQRGTQVSFTAFVDEPLPFPPRYIVLDVHRTFFLGACDAPCSDGVHEIERDGEQIVERWRGGKLFERSFRRLAGQPPGQIAIHYEGGLSSDAPPPPIVLDNEWFGYQLRIVTLN